MTNSYMGLEPLTVLIVGCGNIAGGFDENREIADLPYTHAGAYSLDRRFKITACVEPNEDRRAEFMNKWNVENGFSSIDEILSLDYQFDVISICSPTEFHPYHLEVALQLNPKLIFCEKPITFLLADSVKFVTACKVANVMMAVNHTRRWDSFSSQLRGDILSGRRGELRSIVGVYNKGILNNGSHMLDLLHFLIGLVNVVKVGQPLYDFFPNDPTIPVWLESENGIPIHLVCAHAEDYACFELQLIFSSGILTMEEGGLYWRNRCVVESTAFKNYQRLDDGIRQPGTYPQAMKKAIDNIYNAIASGNKDALISNGESALLAQNMCEKILHLACS